jgi:Excalibur calcium-binding domain
LISGQHRRTLVGVKAALVAMAAAALLVAPARAASEEPASVAAPSMPWLYKNCSHLNSKYRHGVGRRGAIDQTSGTKVTTFRRSTLLYRRAMSYNRGLDRDHDGIACEKL